MKAQVRKWVGALLSKPLISLFWGSAGLLVLVADVAGIVFLFGLLPGLSILLFLCLIVVSAKYLHTVSQNPSKRLEDYMKSLFRLTANVMAEYDESISLIYDIGEKGSKRDMVTSELGLTPVSGFLTWKRMTFGCRGEAGIPTSFDDIEAAAEFSDGACCILPVDETKKDAIDAVVFFDPPINQSETKKLTVRYIWKGLWNPLREKGQDMGGMTLLNERTTRLSVKIRFPGGTENAEWENLPPGANTREGEEGGRLYLEWSLINPGAGKYFFEVKATLPE